MQSTPNQFFASSSHQINLLPGATRSKSLFSTHNPYFLNLLPATSTQSIFWPATARATN